MPEDYTAEALKDPITLQLIDKINIDYSGVNYDVQYPIGLPTRVRWDSTLGHFDSGLVVTPPGFSNCVQYHSQDILEAKFKRLGASIKDYSAFQKKLKRMMNSASEKFRASMIAS